jgi:ligand-binding sensor domain-containing protein
MMVWFPIQSAGFSRIPKVFLWIATWEGMSNYDGHSFTNYSTANGLSHDLVNDFSEAKDGSLYVALNNGTIDIITNNKVIHTDIANKTVVNRFIHSPGHSVIAITDYKGVQQFTDGRLVEQKQSSPYSTFFDLRWINDSIFVAVGDSSIGAFNKNFELLTEIRDIYSYGEIKIYQDSKKRIWVGSPHRT